jgi:hypothetical protein
MGLALSAVARAMGVHAATLAAHERQLIPVEGELLTRWLRPLRTARIRADHLARAGLWW